MADKYIRYPQNIRFVGDGFTSSYRTKMDEESMSIAKHGMNHWKKGLHKKYVSEDKSFNAREFFGTDPNEGLNLLKGKE